MQKRFTVDGSDALEAQLSGVCGQVLDCVRSLVPESRLEALVLGGGYGRGQGGVLQTAAGDRPYNDVEFYVFLRGNRILNERKFSTPLNQLGERLSALAGLHVEFKVDSLERFRRAPISMFSYDLVCGHRQMFGADNIFAGCEHHTVAEKIPVSEATRLLFNRCTGLLLAKDLLRNRSLTPEQSDFVGRNLAKLQLAMGDAVLTILGQYHWSCVERGLRVRQLGGVDDLPWIEEVRRNHAAGVQFKLHPRQFDKSLAQFAAEHHELSRLALQLWLWAESRRLNRRFSSADDYAFSRVEKCFDSSGPRNFLLNLKTFGPRAVFDPMSRRYPRERLFNSLPVLLWDGASTSARARHVQHQLQTAAADWTGLLEAYKRVWPQFG
jgi:hypothetical protein